MKFLHHPSLYIEVHYSECRDTMIQITLLIVNRLHGIIYRRIVSISINCCNILFHENVEEKNMQSTQVPVFVHRA